MAHVELSLSEPSRSTVDYAAGFGSTLGRWAFAVGWASEPCLLLDAAGIVISVSPGCLRLFAIDVGDAVGRRLVDGLLRLLDFSAVSGELPDWEVDKIPPLLALNSGGLARGLLRVAIRGATTTLDAVSTPLREGEAVVGSLTFFVPVAR